MKKQKTIFTAEYEKALQSANDDFLQWQKDKAKKAKKKKNKKYS